MNFLKSWTSKNSFIIIGFFALLFFRFPSFFESFWYGDENYYLAIAQGIVKGNQWLYVGAWDNKPPLIYLVYSASVWLFGIQLWPLRVLNFFLGFLVSFLIYKISKNVFNFNQQISKIAFAICIFLQSIYFEVTIFNGENLFVPLVLLGFYFIAPSLLSLAKSNDITSVQTKIMQTQNNNLYYKIFSGGLVWSLAILTKIPALAEICWLILLIYTIWLVQSIGTTKQFKTKFVDFLQNKKVWFSLATLIFSIALLPILISLIYLANGYFKDLYFAVWQYNNQYYLPENSYPLVLGFTLPFKSLYFRAFLVVSVLILTFWAFLQGQFQKNNLGQNGFIILNWLAISTFGVFIAERNYPHYLQQILPITAILIAWIFSLVKLTELQISTKIAAVVSALVFYQILLTNFTGGSGVLNYFNVDKYWGKNGFNSVILGSQSLANWQRSFDANTIDKTNLLVPIIQKYTNPNDKIFVASSMPEIYAVSGRLNVYKYVVDYHPLIDITEKELAQIIINEAKLVVIDDSSSLSKKLIPYISGNFVLEEQANSRYSVWVKK